MQPSDFGVIENIEAIRQQIAPFKLKQHNIAMCSFCV